MKKSKKEAKKETKDTEDSEAESDSEDSATLLIITSRDSGINSEGFPINS